MVERTVEELITKESEVVICDECGLDSPDVIPFEPEDEDLPTIHLHRHCIHKVSLEEFTHMSVDEAARHNDDYPLLLALDKQDTFFVIGGFTLISLGLVILAISFIGLPLTMVLIIVGSLMMHNGFKYGKKQAKKPVDKLFDGDLK